MKNLDEDIENVGPRVDKFKELLSSLTTLDEKKQALWIEIYRNAIVDRQTAYANYKTLLNICTDKSSEHAVHGRTMAAFLERMNKANEQLIKLAVLVANVQEDLEDDGKKKKNVTQRDLFQMIEDRTINKQHAS